LHTGQTKMLTLCICVWHCISIFWILSDSSPTAWSFIHTRISSRDVNEFSSVTSISTKDDSVSDSKHGKPARYPSKNYSYTVNTVEWRIQGAKSGIDPLQLQELWSPLHNLSLFKWLHTQTFALQHIYNNKKPQIYGSIIFYVD